MDITYTEPDLVKISCHALNVESVIVFKSLVLAPQWYI